MALIKGLNYQAEEMVDGHGGAGCPVTAGKDRDSALQRAEEALQKMRFAMRP